MPLIISVPGKKASVCQSLAELLDLYPTISSLCGLEVPSRLQGKDISRMLDDPSHQARDAAFCVNGQGFLLRQDKWAYIQYKEDASGGIELFDMEQDPKQYTTRPGGGPVVYTQVWSLTFWPKAYFTVALGNAQGPGVAKFLLAVGHNHPMVGQDTSIWPSAKRQDSSTSPRAALCLP